MQTVRELTPVRAEPRDDAEQVTELLAGEPLAVEAQRGDGWARIRTAYDYPGWIRAEALGGVLDLEWLEERSGDPVEEARSYLGARYRWGGLTEKGIDCSGLVHIAHRRLGRLVPRDAHQQEQAGRELGERELAPGDLITYGDEERADHVAFWLGGGRILHATQREGVDGVLEEAEPEELRSRRRKLIRFQTRN